MEHGKYTDNHTIFIKTSVANEEQITDCLVRCLKEISSLKEMGSDTQCDYRLNVVRDRSGKYLGYGFIWLSNSKFYHVMLGNNPDGSPRVEYQFEDEPEIIDIATTNWGDLEETTAVKITLPSLVVFPGYQYNTEQLSHLRNMDPNFSGTMGYFALEPAMVSYSDDGPNNVLICDRPNGIPSKRFPDIIYEYFKCYSNIIGYPKIKKIYDRNEDNQINRVEIIFRPGSLDAKFAFLMTRKFDIPYNNRMITILTRLLRNRI